MKSFILSYKFLLLVFTALPLALCSSNDDEVDKEMEQFETITIDMSNANVQTGDTSFSVDGFNFRSETAMSTEGNVVNDGVLIAPGFIEMDLSAIQGISLITINLFNNSDPIIDVRNNGTVVEDFSTDFSGGSITIELDVEGLAFDALRIFSFEAIVTSIRLE